MSNFEDELIRKFGPREDIVVIPDVPTLQISIWIISKDEPFPGFNTPKEKSRLM